MSWKSLLILLALVVGLVVLNRERQAAIDDSAELVPDAFTLFQGFAPERVRAIRVDNLEAAFQLKLERGASGDWFLTDPIPYPAQEPIVAALLSAMATNLVEEEPDVDPAAAGLDPPRLVVEFVQAEAEGDRVYRLLIGAPDLNQDRVYALASSTPAEGDASEGVLRVTRAIYNTLQRIPDDYRDPRATHLRLPNVVALTRRGSIFDPTSGATRDLTLEMEHVDGVWRRVDSPRMRLDPSLAGFLVRRACEVRAESYARDLPASYAPFGLEPPAFTIELRAGQGEPVVLDFGYPERAALNPLVRPTEWYFRKRDFPHVWRIDTESIDLLSLPSEDLYDSLLLRVLRDDVQRLSLREGERSVVFERAPARGNLAGGPEWLVVTREADGSELRFPAESGPVQDRLAVIEENELRFPDGIELDPADAERELTIETTDGTRWGGWIGGVWRDTRIGQVGHRFKRYGDDRAALLPEAVAELCFLDEVRALDFRSNRIHHVRWSDAKRVALAHGGKEFVYHHSQDDKHWGIRVPRAKELAPAPKIFEDACLALISLRAERWLEDFDEAALEALEDRLSVTVQDAQGAELAFELGRDAEGRVICFENGSAAEVSQRQLASFAEGREVDLLQGLVQLFREQ